MEKQGRHFSDDRVKYPQPSPADEAASGEDTAATEPKQNNEDQRLSKKNRKKLDKLMKKQQRREKHSDREVLSYEDMPLKEREESAGKSRFTKKQIVVAVVIVVLLFAAVFFGANSDRFSLHNISNFVRYGLLNRDSDEKFPLNIQGVNITAGNFVRKGQDICYSSDTRTQVLNNYGKTVFNVPHAFITPVLTSSSNYALVYNLGGTGYQVIDRDGAAYSADMQDNILTGAVNDNGIYALVTQSGGYLSKLWVYNEEHEQIFAYSFADYYVTSVSLSSAGRQAVVSGVSALNGLDITSLYVLDFTKDTPLWFSEFEDNLIYEVRYLSDRYACAVGRSASYVVHTGNGNVETFDYEGKALTAYDINTDTGTYTLSLSNSGDGRNCDIISFGTGGRKERSFAVGQKIIGVSSYKGRVALLTSGSVLLYTKDGSHIGDKALRSDPHSVVLYTGSDAYVLCTGYIDTISW